MFNLLWKERSTMDFCSTDKKLIVEIMNQYHVHPSFEVLTLAGMNRSGNTASNSQNWVSRKQLYQQYCFSFILSVPIGKWKKFVGLPKWDLHFELTLNTKCHLKTYTRRDGVHSYKNENKKLLFLRHRLWTETEESATTCFHHEKLLISKYHLLQKENSL
jgi:hypothetical protein